jgi:hypothetical protein
LCSNKEINVKEKKNTQQATGYAAETVQVGSVKVPISLVGPLWI